MKNNQNLEFQRRTLWINAVTAKLRAGSDLPNSITVATGALASFDETFKPKQSESKPVLLNENTSSQ